MEKIDVAIIGGGIIGLFCAREILLNHPELTVCLFEKELYLGDHSSGRNSGVLHAGLYYETNSMKHLLCLEGNELWNEIASSLNIRMNRCGKYVVARNFEELPQLEKLFENSQKNNVPGMRWCTPEEEQKINQHINCYRAIFSGHTGIIDQGGAMAALRQDIERLGGIVLTSHEVVELKDSQGKFLLKFVNDLIVETRHLINAAGLFAVNLRKQLGLFDIENYYVRGNYIKSSTPNFFEQLIYPVPEKNLKGLGVHLTFDLDGVMKFGPNTEDVTEVSYLPNPEMASEMKIAVSKLFKTIDVEKLSLDYCGIRSKIKKNGVLYSDFWIKSPLKNYVELLGIESPGFTSSPSIARMVVKLMEL